MLPKTRGERDPAGVDRRRPDPTAPSEGQAAFVRSAPTDALRFRFRLPGFDGASAGGVRGRASRPTGVLRRAVIATFASRPTEPTRGRRPGRDEGTGDALPPYSVTPSTDRRRRRGRVRCRVRLETLSVREARRYRLSCLLGSTHGRSVEAKPSCPASTPLTGLSVPVYLRQWSQRLHTTGEHRHG